jgi:hypothetical protein
MDAELFLNGYRVLRGRERAVEDSIRELKERTTSARALRLTAMPRGGGGPTGLEEYIVKAETLLDRLAKRKRRADRALQLITATLADAPELTEVEREVLTKTYIRRWSKAKIAAMNDAGLSRTSVYRALAHGIEALEIPPAYLAEMEKLLVPDYAEYLDETA